MRLPIINLILLFYPSACKCRSHIFSTMLNYVIYLYHSMISFKDYCKMKLSWNLWNSNEFPKYILVCTVTISIFFKKIYSKMFTCGARFLAYFNPWLFHRFLLQAHATSANIMITLRRLCHPKSIIIIVTLHITAKYYKINSLGK